MKFKVGDTVLITSGKDKGKKGEITAVFAEKNKVVVQGANLYVRHIKPFAGQPGQKATKERALPTANIAILNDKDQPDRITYKVAKDGTKERVFAKTGKPVPENKPSKK